MKRDHAMRQLATVWFAGAGLLFVLLFGQTLFDRYGDRAKEAWDWFAAVLLPVVTLIAGAFFSARADAGHDARRVNRRLYGITLGMSVLYLAAVLATVLLSPFSPLSPLDLMASSKLWLELFQGLLATALGVFFVDRSVEAEPAPEPAAHGGG